VTACRANAIRARLGAQGGFTIIEMAIAMLVLVIGLLGVFAGFESAQRLTLVSERHAAMAHIAQQEIEQLEGLAFTQIALTGAPAHSTDPANPDYYVANGPPTTLQWDRNSTTATEQLVTAGGTISPAHAWTEGELSGQVYDFVTWTSDAECSTQCPANGQDYKRLTVAVTIGGGIQPTPVYVSSVVADPASTPSGGISNGNLGNPLKDAATKCQSGNQQVLCTSPINSGNPNDFFLHDFSSWTSGAPQPPSVDHVTHNTANAVTGLPCTALSIVPSLTTGCPQPDLMDPTPPGGSTCYMYSSDQSGTPGCGRLLQSTNDSTCSQGNSAFSSLVNLGSEFWVSSPVTATTTLTGDGGLSMWTQTAGAVNAVVTFCIAIYDVPPSGGSAGSLQNILSWPPTYLGAALYKPPTDPGTGGNWPTGSTATSFIFNFRGSNGSVAIAPGHRLGVRIWANVSGNVSIGVLYDNPLYPAQLELNSL
jgi:Tfp pilus assembly protein PilV